MKPYGGKVGLEKKYIRSCYHYLELTSCDVADGKAADSGLSYPGFESSRCHAVSGLCE